MGFPIGLFLDPCMVFLLCELWWLFVTFSVTFPTKGWTGDVSPDWLFSINLGQGKPQGKLLDRAAPICWQTGHNKDIFFQKKIPTLKCMHNSGEHEQVIFNLQLIGFRFGLFFVWGWRFCYSQRGYRLHIHKIARSVKHEDEPPFLSGNFFPSLRLSVWTLQNRGVWLSFWEGSGMSKLH